MANIELLNVTSATSNETGTALRMDGGQVVVHIRATSYGSDGKVVIKGSCDGTTYTTLPDPNQSVPSAGKAEYSADIVIVVDKLGQGWLLRADLEISSGTATGVVVTASTN